jgi:tetratricopeptide (TPR) repeat protein
MKPAMRVLLIAALAAGCAWTASAGSVPAAGPIAPQAASTSPQEPPLTEKDVVKLIKKNKKNLESVAPEILKRGVDFELTPDIEQSLRNAGADDTFIANVKNQGPSERASMAAATARGATVPPEESEGFQAIRNELDPSRKIQLADEFATKYPQSPMLTYAYFLAQGASLQKGDLNSFIDYGEKSLAAKEDNLNALMLMARVLPQPQVLRNEMNPDVRLNEAEKDGQKALELINALTKVAEEPEEAFQRRKAEYLQNIHSGLAMVHLQRAMEGLAGPDPEELAKAEEEYKAAIAASPEVNPEDYFRLGEVYSNENKIDEAIQAFTKVAQMAADNPTVKGLAEQRIEELKKKPRGAAPTSPPSSKKAAPQESSNVQAANRTCKEGALKEAQVLDLVVNHVPEPRLVALVKERGICFPVTGDIAARLKDNGATEEFISALRGVENPSGGTQ